MWAVIMLFVLVIGGMYGGFFTPTEGAGVGAFGGFLFALLRGQLRWATLFEILSETAQTTAVLFMIVIGASIFSNFVNFTTLPSDLQQFVTRFDVPPIMVIVLICAIYVVLGSAMEELSMMLLTVPIFFPLVTGLGFDPVWFGILVVCVISIGMISPPVGMNVFVLSSVLPDVPTSRIWRGVMPFLMADLVRLGILIAVPSLTLFLPRLLKL
jgi:C4-dicarboxylate transporter DctM subunit